jgi:hypothetical protein
LGTVEQRAHRAQPIHIFVEAVLHDREVVFGDDVKLRGGVSALPARGQACGAQRHGDASCGRKQGRQGRTKFADNSR